MERGRGGKGEREGWETCITSPPLASASNTTLYIRAIRRGFAAWLITKAIKATSGDFCTVRMYGNGLRAGASSGCYATADLFVRGLNSLTATKNGQKIQ